MYEVRTSKFPSKRLSQANELFLQSKSKFTNTGVESVKDLRCQCSLSCFTSISNHISLETTSDAHARNGHTMDHQTTLSMRSPRSYRILFSLAIEIRTVIMEILMTSICFHFITVPMGCLIKKTQ